MSQEMKKAVRDAESKQFRESEKAIRDAVLHRHATCSHRHPNDWAIGLQHNFPDMMARGVCLLCGLVIKPARWEVGAPNQINRMNADPLYPIVLLLESREVELILLERRYEADIDALLGGNNRFATIAKLTQAYNTQRIEILEHTEKLSMGFYVTKENLK